MAGLDRTVLADHRLARMLGLCDRTNPESKSPGLVLNEQEDLDVIWAPFTTSSDRGLRRKITLYSQVPFAPWESEENGPSLSASIGHVLPHLLDKANAGKVTSKVDLLLISWQSLNHDEGLLDANLNPHVVELTIALQLANRPGRLVKAIFIIIKKFPGALLWAPGIGGPDICAVLTWVGIDLFDITRTKQAKAHSDVLTWNGPRVVTEDQPEVDHCHLAITETRSTISNHSLRELAQSQSIFSPRLFQHMRHFDNLILSKEGVLSQIVDSSSALQIHSVDSHDDPIILDCVNFMANNSTSPEGLDDKLVLLPCSARKSYSFSRSNRSFHRAINHNAAHEVMVASLLGLVSRDLEQTWSTGYYDIPFDEEWTQDKIIRVTQIINSLVERNNYHLIINHSGMEYKYKTPLIDTYLGSSTTNLESL